MDKITELKAQLHNVVDERDKIDLLNELVYQLRRHNLAASSEYIDQVSDLLKKYPDYAAGEAMLRVNQGMLAGFEGDYEAAIARLSTAIDWYRQNPYPLNLARALNILGRTYIFGGDQSGGLEVLLEALSIAEAHNLREEYGGSLLNIGLAHIMTEIPERMELGGEVTRKALAVMTELNNTFYIAVAHNNLSAQYERLGNLDGAIEHGLAAFSGAREHGNYPIALMSATGLAKVYDLQGDIDTSDQYLAESFAIREHLDLENGFAPFIGQHLFHVAKIYMRREDWQKAKEYLAEGVRVSHNGHVRNVEFGCHELLAIVCEKQGAFAEALEHHRQFYSIKQQVFNDQNELKFKRISATYQLKQAQADAAFQKALQEEGQRHILRLQTLIEDLETFSSSVSHDLRAPLRSIISFSHILEQDYSHQLDTEGQDYLHRIIRSGRRMERLIDDLLRLARISQTDLQIESVDLSQLAQEIAIHLNQSQPERNVNWTIVPGMVVQGDRGLLYAALENLLGNAWKYSGKREDACIEFGTKQIHDEIVYYVHDNGAGFDMNYADKLFKMFERLHKDDEFEGTGVGLANVQRIIQRHGGRIWAKAAVEQGATFYFTLPYPRTFEVSKTSKSIE